MKIRPLGGRVLVKPLETEEVTASGIVLPDNAKEKPQQGEIVAVGPGITNQEGKYVPLEVKVGDKVFYTKYAGHELKDGDDILLIMDGERDIMAVLG
ncbi:MAG: co-chaperone GroES [Bacillota bacterium]|jgi:chaperonin GroES